jgi:hypothetical protein
VRAFIGFILGVLVTIGCAYEYDASTGRAANGLTAASAEGQAPMVNWDIVSGDWQTFQANVRATADNLQQRLKQHTG